MMKKNKTKNMNRIKSKILTDGEVTTSHESVEKTEVIRRLRFEITKR